MAGDGIETPIPISEEAERIYRYVAVGRVCFESMLQLHRSTRQQDVIFVLLDIKVEVRLALPVADAEYETVATTTLPPPLELVPRVLDVFRPKHGFNSVVGEPIDEKQSIITVNLRPPIREDLPGDLVGAVDEERHHIVPGRGAAT